MATIVQPYNPWKEQLALTALGNVAGNILSDLWQSHRQNEQNRKANAFRGQLQQNLQNTAQPEISLMPKEAPQGYNSNPWANAMHQNYTPLTAFDIGTSTVGKAPSIQDIVQGADSLAASKRFSMLSPELVQGVKNSIIQQSIADMFGNTGNLEEQMRALTMGAARGVVAPQVLMAFSPYAQKMAFPYSFGESDLGQSKVITVRNEHTGEITPGVVMPVSVSPDTAATVAGSQNVAKINAGSAENVARIHALGDEARAQATVQAQQLKIWQEQHKALSEEIANDRANLAGLNEQEAIAMQSIINQKEQRLAQLEMLMSSAYSGTGSSQATQGTTARNPANSNNVWFGMVGNPEGISIHPHGTFGYDRGDHKHGGIDIRGVSEGTDIRAMPQMGSSFIVRQAYKSDSYGNNIVIESDRKFNGKSIKFRIAHMQDGSLNFKPGQTIKAGDIIGKVGSTGRSTGPHIHLEVMVDGHLVDPQNFFQQFPLDNTAQATATQSSTPQQQPQATPTQTQPQTTAQPTTQGQTNTVPDNAYLVHKDDSHNYLTMDDFMEMARKNNMTQDQLLYALRKKDFIFPGEFVFNPQYYTSDSNGNQYTKEEFSAMAQEAGMSEDEYMKVLKGNYDTTEPQVPLTALTEPQPVPALPDSYSDKNRRNSPPNTAGNPHAGVSQGNVSDFFSVPWGSFDIHQPILGGQRQLPLPQQQTVSQDSRLSPLFSGKAINAASDFLKGLNLTSGDETSVIPPMHENGFFQYTDNPIPNDPRYNPHVSFPQGLPAGNAYNPQPGEFPNNFSDKNRRNTNPYIETGYYRGGVETRPWSFADLINRYANNENTFRPPLSALSSSKNPSNKSLRYYSGNMAGGLLPENAYDREKIDGEYQFLDPQLTALNGGLPYWYGGPLSDDAYQINFLLNSLGVTADKYPYIKKY